jgi:hypothetical protein
MKHILTIATLTLASSLTSAATFNFTGLGSVPGSGYSNTVDGITVTITAPGENLGYLNADGIGVKRNCCDLSGLQNNEDLLVSFSEEVTIGSLTFRQWEGPDRVQLNSAGGNLDLNDDTSAFGSSESFDLSALTGITSFTLEGNSFATVTLLASLGNVQASASAVPVPAAAWLFGSALIGLVGVGRRK